MRAMGERTLELTLISAKNLNKLHQLPDEDSKAKRPNMEVYAVVSLYFDGCVKPVSKERTVPDTMGGRNPTWNATFHYTVPASGAGYLEVVFKAENKGIPGHSEVVGKVSIHLSDLLSNTPDGAVPEKIVKFPFGKIKPGEPPKKLKYSYKLGEVTNYAPNSASAAYAQHPPADANPPAARPYTPPCPPTAYPPAGQPGEPPATAYPRPSSAYPHSVEQVTAHPAAGHNTATPYAAPPPPPSPGYGTQYLPQPTLQQGQQQQQPAWTQHLPPQPPQAGHGYPQQGQQPALGSGYPPSPQAGHGYPQQGQQQPALGLYPPQAGHGYPYQQPAPGSGYPSPPPPQAGHGYPHQQPALGSGYPPSSQAGHGYPQQGGYGYQQQAVRPPGNQFIMGVASRVGTGLVGNAFSGMMTGFFDNGAGYDDGGSDGAFD